MTTRTRRELLADIGKGMVLAGLGPAVAADLGIAPAWAGEEPRSLSFGDLDPLVEFVRSTPPDTLLPLAVEKIRAGTDLKRLVAAAALANARAFGGEDYVGFHTLMALPPAYHMAAEEADERRRPLAVLKVLVRNATRLKEAGPSAETLRPVQPGELAADRPAGEQLRDAARAKNLDDAERTFAAVCRNGAADALNPLMVMVDDGAEVHRIVLVARAWELAGFVGPTHAHTLLRQSVHYCVRGEAKSNQATYFADVRALLPTLIDRHRLLAPPSARREADDAWVARMADTLFRSNREQAAEAAALALAEGFAPEAVAEAVSLAANQLVLRDEGRLAKWASPNKPAGSVHGDSVGVHACDAANAWRNLARAGDARTRVTSVVMSAYHLARDREARGAEFLKWEPYPRGEHREAVKGVPAASLLTELDGAVREKAQARAAALTARVLAERAATPAEVFALLRKYAISEDGALHAEKYYRTVTEEYAAARPAFRDRQLVALARVTASAYGYAAPGHTEACRLLGV
jgi:hypothetical protein